MFVVFLVAILLGTSTELQNRYKRSRSAMGANTCLREIEYNRKQIAVCREKQGTPYSWEDREKSGEHLGIGVHWFDVDLQSWIQELQWRVEIIKEYEKNAREMSEKRDVYHRRLLFPWIP